MAGLIKATDVWGQLESKYTLSAPAQPQVAKLAELVLQLRRELESTKQQFSHSLRTSIERIDEAERGRRAALQEAIYLKTKSTALASVNIDMLAKVNSQRITELERRLANTINENDALRNQMIESTLALKQAQERLAEYRADSDATRVQLRNLQLLYSESQQQQQHHHQNQSQNQNQNQNQNLDQNNSLKVELDLLRSAESRRMLDLENALRTASASNSRADNLQALIDKTNQENLSLQAQIVQLTTDLEAERSMTSNLNIKLLEANNSLIETEHQLKHLRLENQRLLSSHTTNSLTEDQSLQTSSFYQDFLAMQTQWSNSRDEIMHLKQLHRDADEKRREVEFLLAIKERELLDSQAKLSAFTKLVMSLDPTLVTASSTPISATFNNSNNNNYNNTIAGNSGGNGSDSVNLDSSVSSNLSNDDRVIDSSDASRTNNSNASNTNGIPLNLIDQDNNSGTKGNNISIMLSTLQRTLSN